MPDPIGLVGYGFADASPAIPGQGRRLIDDGVRAYCSASWKQGSAAFSILTVSATMRFRAVTGPDGSAATAACFTSAVAAASGPGPGWVGKLIGIATTPGDTIVVISRVVDFVYDPANRFAATLVLEGAVPEGMDGSACRVACPCFGPSDTGKRIWISNAAHPKSGDGNPIAIVPLRSTIARFVTPFVVELADAIGAASVSEQPGSLVVWGTDNSALVRGFGRQALAAGQKSLTFTGAGRPGSTARVWAAGDGGRTAEPDADGRRASGVHRTGVPVRLGSQPRAGDPGGGGGKCGDGGAAMDHGRVRDAGSFVVRGTRQRTKRRFPGQFVSQKRGGVECSAAAGAGERGGGSAAFSALCRGERHRCRGDG